MSLFSEKILNVGRKSIRWTASPFISKASLSKAGLPLRTMGSFLPSAATPEPHAEAEMASAGPGPPCFRRTPPALWKKSPWRESLALPAGDEVQDGDLALLEPAAADLVRAVDVHGAADVALVKLHEGPAVDDDGYRPHRVAQRAMRQLLG